MAIRPVYEANDKGSSFVKVHDVNFKWYPGFSTVQKQKSIKSLHKFFKSSTRCKYVLEISSKSNTELGVMLSAFNLEITQKNSRKKTSVESVFQGSKKFEHGGPFQELYLKPSKEAKKDDRLKKSGKLIGFNYFGDDKWPIEPKTLFYDWIYLNALNENKDLGQKILKYSAFTDIEFNPGKSVNCQAYSAALFVSLWKRGMLEKALDSKHNYINIMGLK